ncbi:MAG: hypothetical protein JWN07_3265 [Hyphomicrobiales bacterium]|nr:hypothetical protein [Hyphomicrobiales bacterium]
MSSVSHACRYCGKLSSVPLSRIRNAKAIKCDACLILASVTDDERSAMVRQSELSPRPLSQAEMKHSER